jgi:hypothetical protein
MGLRQKQSFDVAQHNATAASASSRHGHVACFGDGRDQRLRVGRSWLHLDEVLGKVDGELGVLVCSADGLGEVLAQWSQVVSSTRKVRISCSLGVLHRGGRHAARAGCQRAQHEAAGMPPLLHFESEPVGAGRRTHAAWHQALVGSGDRGGLEWQLHEALRP